MYKCIALALSFNRKKKKKYSLKIVNGYAVWHPRLLKIIWFHLFVRTLLLLLFRVAYYGTLFEYEFIK